MTDATIQLMQQITQMKLKFISIITVLLKPIKNLFKYKTKYYKSVLFAIYYLTLEKLGIFFFY